MSQRWEKHNPNKNQSQDQVDQPAQHNAAELHSAAPKHP